MSTHWLQDVPTRWRADGQGITSVCSAHPTVIATSLKYMSERCLIEATCNQVNQEGGYTGMTPESFRKTVDTLADKMGIDKEHIAFGGDHLGPNPWRHLPAEPAMQKAEAMVVDYVRAGFSKLHLDTSMACRDDPVILEEGLIAERAARLAKAAAVAARQAQIASLPVLVIGTEVPKPGGTTHALESIEITRPEAALSTYAVHADAFNKCGVGEQIERVVAVIVQPGVEFGNDRVAAYVPALAANLSAVLVKLPGIVFEAHSTDYQPPAMLRALVSDGFAILKVGPALTFAMREALYGLDRIARALDATWREHSVEDAMERLMLGAPADWAGHYSGGPKQQHLLRHYSYSDRIRYYWPRDEARSAIDRLMRQLGSGPLPEVLISQFLPRSYPAVRDGLLAASPMALVEDAIKQALGPYREATTALAARPTSL